MVALHRRGTKGVPWRGPLGELPSNNNNNNNNNNDKYYYYYHHYYHYFIYVVYYHGNKHKYNRVLGLPNNNSNHNNSNNDCRRWSIGAARGFEHVESRGRNTIAPVVTYDPHSSGPPSFLLETYMADRKGMPGSRLGGSQ